MEVTLICGEPNPSGVCLYEGCIPSKALRHVAKTIRESAQAAAWGIEFPKPKIKIKRLRAWKEEVIQTLTGGLGRLGKQRRIRYIQGKASFANSITLHIQRKDGSGERVDFDKAILAIGSHPTPLPRISGLSSRVWDSQKALTLPAIP
jgi:dihydrolipoamide dehydrogenase